MEMVLRKCSGKVLVAFLGVVVSFFFLPGCASTSTCDNCGITFSGNGYFDVLRDYDYTLCAECAQEYYEPLPYEPYKKD